MAAVCVVAAANEAGTACMQPLTCCHRPPAQKNGRPAEAGQPFCKNLLLSEQIYCIKCAMATMFDSVRPSSDVME